MCIYIFINVYIYIYTHTHIYVYMSMRAPTCCLTICLYATVSAQLAVSVQQVLEHREQSRPVPRHRLPPGPPAGGEGGGEEECLMHGVSV